MGRHAKPIAVHLAEGTYRADRHGNRGPQTGGEPLRKPDGLAPAAGWLWDEVTRQRGPWLCASDAAALQTLCDAYGFMRACEPRLRANATDKAARQAWSVYHGVFEKLGAKFGLTPSDRAKLGENTPKRDTNSELEELLR